MIGFLRKHKSGSHCPFCGEEINVEEVRWSCPACGFRNLTTALDTCADCHFSPRLFDCPHCGESYESWLLIGGFDGPYAKVFKPDAYPIKTTIKVNVRDLKVTWLADTSEASIATPSDYTFKDVLACFLDGYFEIPYTVDRMVVHTAHRSDPTRLWMHSWLYSPSALGPPRECQVQVSVLCELMPEWPEVSCVITDIQMAQ
jgi:predicted RNA-binding Zn-ribbon protein involved in translation (DUF1610 family)